MIKLGILHTHDDGVSGGNEPVAVIGWDTVHDAVSVSWMPTDAGSSCRAAHTAAIGRDWIEQHLSAGGLWIEELPEPGAPFEPLDIQVDQLIRRLITATVRTPQSQTLGPATTRTMNSGVDPSEGW